MALAEPPRGASPLLRLVLAIPVLGWMLRDALYGRRDAAAWGAATAVMLFILALTVWGYAALITVYLFLAAVCLAGILAISRA